MYWQVDYCQPAARRELDMINFTKIVRGGAQATPARRITEGGISGQKAYLKDAAGNRIDPCADTPNPFLAGC